MDEIATIGAGGVGADLLALTGTSDIALGHRGAAPVAAQGIVAKTDAASAGINSAGVRFASDIALHLQRRRARRA